MNTPINHLTAGFIGLGLIGGSIARGLKRSAPDIQIMAYMRTREKLEQAHADGIVDLILDGVDEHLSECDIIFLCTPVEFNESYLRQIRPFLKEGAVVTDVGSTKTSIHETVAALGMESCFVGGHPMAGSEKTGYESSTDHLLENAYYIITPTPHTPASYTDRMVDVANAIGALPLVLDYHRHDFIVAGDQPSAAPHRLQPGQPGTRLRQRGSDDETAGCRRFQGYHPYCLLFSGHVGTDLHDEHRQYH